VIGLIPRLRPDLGYKEILSALSFSQGNIPKFESEFAQKFNCAHGTMFPHGRTGIYALLKVWGLGNCEIICPAYTCVVVPHAIVLSGNIPSFVDCEEGSLNMSYSGIEDAINQRTRAIVVTHVFGYPMDVNRINDIVAHAEAKYGQKIYVIQDVAYSFGAKSRGQFVTEFGDASIFGLNISKILTSIYGGMVISNDNNLNDRLQEYRSQNLERARFRGVRRLLYLLAVYVAFNLFVYRIINFLERIGLIDRFVKYYDESLIQFPNDWNELPTEIEARVGLQQLKKYEFIVQERVKNAKNWIVKLQSNDEITFFEEVEGTTFSHCVGLVKDREAWLERYFKAGIQLGIVLEYSIPYMKSYLQFKTQEYPISKYYSEHIINFPVWAGLPPEL